jgi:hypothetical protein
MKNYTKGLLVGLGLIGLAGLWAACDEPNDEVGQDPDGAGPNYCLEFDGDGDYVAVAHHDAFDLGPQWTLECWAVLDDTVGSRPLLRKGGQNTETASFFIYGNDVTERVSAGYRINDVNSGLQVASTTTLGTEVWHHLALVNDGERLTLYVDGLAEDSCATEEEALSADLSDLIFGANLYGSSFLRGKLDELRVSDGVRYDGDFEPAVRFEQDAHTAALWHFDEGEGAGVFDEVVGLRGDIVGDVAFTLR